MPHLPPIRSSHAATTDSSGPYKTDRTSVPSALAAGLATPAAHRAFPVGCWVASTLQSRPLLFQPRWFMTPSVNAIRPGRMRGSVRSDTMQCCGQYKRALISECYSILSLAQRLSKKCFSAIAAATWRGYGTMSVRDFRS